MQVLYRKGRKVSGLTWLSSQAPHTQIYVTSYLLGKVASDNPAGHASPWLEGSSTWLKSPVVSGFTQVANEVLHIVWLWTHRTPAWPHPCCCATGEQNICVCTALLAVWFWLYSELFVCAIWCLCDLMCYMQYEWSSRGEAGSSASIRSTEKRDLVVLLQYMQFSCVSAERWEWTVIPEH